MILANWRSRVQPWSPRAPFFQSWSPGALHFLARNPGALNPFIWDPEDEYRKSAGNERSMRPISFKISRVQIHLLYW